MTDTNKQPTGEETVSNLPFQEPTQTDYWSRLAAAKSEFPVFVKDTEGYGYSYVTLDSIQKVIQPILHKHGLILLHSLTFRDGIYGVYSVLLSCDGQNPPAWLRDSFFPVNHAAKPQDVGSARTYGTRYNVTTMLDLILVGEDDDGAVAQGNSVTGGKSKGKGKAPAASASKAKKVAEDETDW